MISAGVKSNIKQQEIKDLVAASYTNYYKKYPQNFKCNVKRVCIYHLILFGIPSILVLSVKNSGVRERRAGGGGGGAGVFLNGQNLLSVTKVICRQSLG